MLDASLALTGLALGVAASAHCSLMCSAPCAALAGGRRATLLFHLGRLASYATAGAVAAWSVAALGQWTQAAPWTRPLWMLSHLAFLALALWWLVTGRALGRLAIKRPPTFIAMPVRGRQPRAAWRSGLAGLAWAALPCGMLHGALGVAALASGPLGGASVMGAFALGSLPALAVTPWVWARWQAWRGPSGAGAGALGYRVAGAGLLMASGWALATIDAPWQGWCAG
jgi:sulfite exporter TauE/SafE